MKKITFVILFFLILLAVSCNRKETLKTGDLIFVAIPEDYDADPDSMSSAITSSTADGSALNYIHVAIAEVEGGKTWIIDATLKHGVDRYPLDTFLTDFTLRDGSYPVFEVMRMKDVSRVDAFVKNAMIYVGQPYDCAFLPDNGAAYCTELVHDSYLSPEGAPLFDNAPMNFLDAEGNMPVYWEKLFAKMGYPVPQGVPGTNPQAMRKSDLLRPVDVDITR